MLENKTADFEVSIWDTTGRNVGFYQNTTEIYTGNMAKGAYIVKVRSGGQQTVKKLLLI